MNAQLLIIFFSGSGDIQNVRHSQNSTFYHVTNYAKNVTNYGMTETKLFCAFGCSYKPCYLKGVGKG